MYSSVRLFMEKLIDYAGMFPPAGLPIDAAIRNYYAYSHDQDSWMLGKFVIPVSRLPEVIPYLPLFTPDHPLRLSVIGQRSSDEESCIRLLADSLQALERFKEQVQGAAQVEGFELPLPPIPLSPALLQAIGRGTGPLGLHTFCELTYGLNKDWESRMLAGLDEITALKAAGGMSLGLKLRTGGLSAEDFPTALQVAFVIAACRDRHLPLKFTAGLHHPVRMYRSEVQTHMHGFVNVFAAGLLAHSHQLDFKRIAEILADEQASSFQFSSEGLHWKQFSMTSSEIAAYRDEALCSFGSCSFDEPREEMRAVQLLAQRR
ncbi:hypothetical protein [Paenibacillus aestuarii]|uniref:HpcH/HpaI aldolase/citrate lyase domain-containing protein n=1 Tax=Paenibacillus aestuarii TaxID=516965 RepID=A0ABW0KHY7_9BACL|nr:hypothetical protein [Paenibacillus aestuarii]